MPLNVREGNGNTHPALKVRDAKLNRGLTHSSVYAAEVVSFETLRYI